MTRRRPRTRSDLEMTPHAREAMFRCQRITREMRTLDQSPHGQTRYLALAGEKTRLLAVTHADWLRRCRP